MSRAVVAFIALLACLAASPLPSRASALSRGQIARIDAIVRAAMAKQHLAGVEVGVGRNGRVLFSRGYGLRDRRHDLPVTANTVFPIGSITKSFTATAVMLLVQQGNVALDAAIGRYLPTVPHARRVTVRELLDQTSGLPDYLDNVALFRSILNSTVRPRPIARYVAMVDGKPLHFKPGSKWEYSNTNYAILGMLVRKITGESYPAFFQQRIFGPFGLTSTQVVSATPPRGNDVADGYTFTKSGFVAIAPQSMSWGNSAGAIATDARDLITFDGAFFAGKIVSPASVRTMLTPPPNRPLSKTKTPLGDLAGGYGFGWVRGSDEGRRVEWHNGGIIGGRTMNAVWPRDGLEIVVLTNVTTAEPESIALQISRVLLSR
jgi:D-alanyl-D-alanine carboxypeptidase